MTTTTLSIVNKLELCIFLLYEPKWLPDQFPITYAVIFIRGGPMAIHAPALFLLALFATNYYTVCSI